LNAASVRFATSSNQLKKKHWWENFKMQLLIGGVILALIIIVLTSLYVKLDKGSDVYIDGEKIELENDKKDD